jgi:hypothetical protein
MNSNDTELLSGQFYSESYDMKINDPTKEFLLVMDNYLDKTGKSAGITSSCGKPVIWTHLCSLVKFGSTCMPGTY